METIRNRLISHGASIEVVDHKDTTERLIPLSAGSFGHSQGIEVSDPS